MGFAIRLATPEDERAVASVLEVSYPPLYAGHYDPALLARALPAMVRAQPRLLASGRFFLAEDESGAPVGCGGWSPERPGGDEVEPGTGHVRHFAVVADRIGRGIGRALFEACLTQARAAGVARLEAFSSLNGEPFYAALGFERVGPILVEMGPDLRFPSVLMRRRV